ncbi:unnamed protein product [Rotaria sp. Silwood1]|nr:unnamed protein product [Rotaria sp. Silwood1]CAF5078128.1 unnamed protein product [Rotaria sp. Silwood1]
MINYESFETPSTKATTNDHHLYYWDTNYLKLDMRKITSRFTSVSLFQHNKYLVIYYYRKAYSTWLNNSLNIEFIDNQSLFSIFKQIKILKSITENCYVPSDFSLKFVQHFPSLTDIELQVYSFDDCIYALDILLSHLKNLSYLKIYYIEVSSLDQSFSLNYIINKRRQAFGFNITDEHKITIIRNKESVEIRS